MQFRYQRRIRLSPMYGFFWILCISLVAIQYCQAETQQAAIASAHPLATRAGLETLRQGGNAFDAAVAVASTLAVVEPQSSGLGGGGFWLLHRASDGYETLLDSRERAPLAATADMYLDAAGEVIDGLSLNGPLAAGIPGIPAALEHLATEYGRLPLKQTLASAIEIAGKGFAVDEVYRKKASVRVKEMRNWPETAKIFLQDNSLPATGYVIKQPDLAKTLRNLAAHGAKGFYRGETAQQLVDGVCEAGGIWSLEDLRDYTVVEREPVRGEYRGVEIVSAPPPSSGGVVLIEMLNILAGYDLADMNESTRTHVIVEAMRRAYRDRAEYLGDPDFVDMPLDLLLSPYYAAGLRAGIRHDRATPSRALPGILAASSDGEDTTHFSILDAEGNRVAATLSVNFPFGSAFVVPGTGVLLNDEMDDFITRPGVPNVYGLVGANPNQIAPGKRMLSSMTPTFLQDDQRTAILGTPGGSRIITMVLLALLDFTNGGDVVSMVNRPRFHHQYLPDRIGYEANAFSTDLLQKLGKLGHTTDAVGRRYGNMHVVIQNRKTGALTAASDNRGIGLAKVIDLAAETDVESP